MAELVRMPKMSDTMKEGVIAAWHKNVGDKVSSGDILAEIETDKATMELESYEDGILLYIGPKAGDAVPIDGVIAIIGEKGEDVDAVLSAAGGSPAAETEAVTTEPAAAAPAPQAEAVKIDTSGIDAEVLRMPKMTDTMTEGNFVAWHKKIGDKIASGDILAEVETDKATMELESYSDGTLLYIGVEAGSAIPINGIIAIIGAPGADYQTLLKAESAPVAAPVAKAATPAAVATPTAAAPVAQAAAPAPKVAVPVSADGKVKASPLAKKLAEDKGINLGQVAGTGPNGRVIKADVESYVPAAAPAAGSSVAAVGVESFEDTTMNSMRKAIARNLSSSQFGAPHFYLTMDIDMEKAMAARVSMNEVASVKISFNDIVVKAVAASLKQHPLVNSMVLDDVVRINNHIHVGVAVAIPDGLVVPVIKHTDTLSLSQISATVRDLAGKAKDKKLSMDQMTGATFTISNLGMFGIEQFTSIINAPASCIMAIGGIKEVPVVKNGQVVPGNVMKVTLTCDHRSVDGAIGAAFLQTFKGLMEDPVRILI